jgi:thioredoxin-related protein
VSPVFKFSPAHGDNNFASRKGIVAGCEDYEFSMEPGKMPKTLPFALVVLVCVAWSSGCDDNSNPQSASQSQQLPKGKVATATAPPPQADRNSDSGQIQRGRMRFVEGYRAGAEAAAAQRKPMLLFFTASWCHYCHQLAAEAFTDSTVVGLSERFVCVLIDADREPSVCRYFQVPAYPTIQFISSRGQPLNRIVGKQPSREVVRQMQAALQQLARADKSDTKAN